MTQSIEKALTLLLYHAAHDRTSWAKDPKYASTGNYNVFKESATFRGPQAIYDGLILRARRLGPQYCN